MRGTTFPSVSGLIVPVLGRCRSGLVNASPAYLLYHYASINIMIIGPLLHSQLSESDNIYYVHIVSLISLMIYHFRSYQQAFIIHLLRIYDISLHFDHFPAACLYQPVDDFLGRWWDRIDGQ